MPGGYHDPFFSQAWGQPGTVIPLPDGGQIIVPAEGFSQAEYDALSGIRAGNAVGGPFAQQIIANLIQRGALTPGTGSFYGSAGGDAPQSMYANEPPYPGDGPSPQSASSSQSGGGPPPYRAPAPGPQSNRGQAPVYRQPTFGQPTPAAAPAYARGLAQRLAAQRGQRVSRPYAAPTPNAPPPFDPGTPPPGAGGPRPRGPGWDMNSPKPAPRPPVKPGGGSPPFYPPGNGTPDSQLPTKPTTTTKPYGAR